MKVKCLRAIDDIDGGVKFGSDGTRNEGLTTARGTIEEESTWRGETQLKIRS